MTMLICLDVPGTNMDGSPMSSAREDGSEMKSLRAILLREISESFVEIPNSRMIHFDVSTKLVQYS